MVCLKKHCAIIVLALFLFIPICCSMLKTKNSVTVPDIHPAEVSLSRVTCTECHSEPAGGTLRPVEEFNHTTIFVESHGEYAASEGKLCLSCHTRAFCADCHADKGELKPGVKHGDRSDRIYPHRGDYLMRHRIDGRMNPEVCFKCHGRQNNGTCIRCHKES